MELRIGNQIKGYELKERIGSGGFGAVYRATQSTVGREVAMKIILPGLTNQPDFIRRFESEAHLIARLEHMNIVPLYDYWRDPDGAYLVMRWLRGGSLQDVIHQQGALGIEEAVQILEQVAQALHTAHRNQVIHRDIKPGNILLDEDGNAYLADFGIAKDHALIDEYTNPDAIVGSPDYLAPEQARSEAVTPQTDIYSLGVVVYEMLAGEHPFPNLTAIERLYKHLNEPLPDLNALEKSISTDINDVIQKATAKDPQQRFKDAVALAQALREAVGLDRAPTSVSLVELLTPREQEVLKLLMEGKSNREIADALVVEVATVKWYNKNIYRKLNVRSRVQAIVKARELDLIVAGTDSHVSSISHLPEPVNPYKGLQAFQAADAQDFFGREKLINKLLKRLQENVAYQRFLAIVGPSGSGKSSTVKAGLTPALWRGELPGSDNWYIVDFLPGRHPLDELEIALTRISPQETRQLNEHLRRDERGLVRVANLVLPDDGSQLLIIIDQFEEVFTLVDDEAERQQLLNLLQYAVTEDRSRVRVVVTLRADYYDRPLEYPDFGKLMQTRVETVLPLSAEELEQAVHQPAKQVGMIFEDGLVSRIISDVHYQPGALPLLQYALTELFERRDERSLTLQAYEAIGGAGGALAQRADEIYLEGTDESQELVRQMFLHLVTLGEGAEDTRRRTRFTDLLSLTEKPDVMEEIIDTFAAYRLLSLDRDEETRQPTVEVAHEAILREWDRLRQWLNESRDDIRRERQVARAAEEWEGNGRDTSYLLRGARLEQLEVWRATTNLTLAPLEAEFIRKSIEVQKQETQVESERIAREAAQERRSQTLLRALVAVFAVAALFSGGFGIFAILQRNDAIEARDGEAEARQEALIQASIGLASQAVAELDSDAPERGVLLALEALENYPYTWQAEQALAQIVYGTHQYISLRSARNRVRDIAFSPDGTLIVGSGELSNDIWDSRSGEWLTEFSMSTDEQEVAGVDWFSDSSTLLTASAALHIARVWDVETGDELLRYEGHDGAVNAAYVSTNDSMALTASADGTAHIWSIETGEMIQIFTGHVGTVEDAIWSPDNSQIATASDDGTIRFWDVDSGRELLRLDAHLGGVTAVTWSPDGTRIASAGNDGLGRVWDVETGNLIITLIGHDAAVRDIEWSPDGNLLATAGGDSQARVWESVAGREMFALGGGDADIVSISWSPDSQRLVVGAGTTSRVWEITTPVVRLVGVAGDERGTIITNFPYWSPDSQWVGTGGLLDDTYRIWDPIKGENLTTFAGVTEGDGFVNPQGTEIFLINPVRIVNLETGEERSFPVPEGYGELINGSWSPDGRQIIIQNDVNPEYAIYDVETQTMLFSSSQRCTFNAPMFWSPDNQHLVQTCFSGEFTSVIITEALTDLVVQEFEGHTDGIVFADWSPDGIRLATASFDQTVRVWDVKTGEALVVFAGHTSGVFDVDWSPDGTRLVSGDTAGNVLVWDANTGQEVNRYNVGGSVIFLEWSPDGTRVLTTGVFDAPDIHPVWQSTQELIAYAKVCCVLRELSSEERQQFGLPEQ